MYHLAGPPQREESWVPVEWEQPCAGRGGGEAVLSPLAEGLSERRDALLCGTAAAVWVSPSLSLPLACC